MIGIDWLLGGLLLLLTLAALLAPLESLGWWSGWLGDPDASDDTASGRLDLVAQHAPLHYTHYIVFLSGVGALASDSIPKNEIVFVDCLKKRLPTTQVVSDVFPYSVTNQGLTTARLFSWLWSWIDATYRGGKSSIFYYLVNLRNLFQVAVSADVRYGPIYNLGVAREIRDGLVRAGYPLDSGLPVTLIGWSGGAQISLGAAEYLGNLMDAPLWVISVGGVMSGDPGIARVERLWHLYGSRDIVQRIGRLAFPARWRLTAALVRRGWLKAPAWVQAEQAGKIELLDIGPFTHTGSGGYFDFERVLPDGHSYAQATLDRIVAIVADAGLEPAPAPTFPLTVALLDGG